MIAGSAHAAPVAPFQSLSPYNVYVTGNHTASNTTYAGRVGVGGSANYTSVRIGDRFANQSTGLDSLVVASDLLYQQGVVQGGGIVAGGRTNITGVVVGGGGVRVGSSPINVTAAAQFLRDAGATWKSVVANGAVNQMPWGDLVLGGTDRQLNVFSVDAGQLAVTRSLRIHVPGTSTVLINVRGDAATLRSARFSLNGLDASAVLFNFADATTLTIDGTEVLGSVLAPKADIAFTNGQVRGQIFGMALNGNGRAADQPFTGTLPAVSVIPLPAPVLLASAGLALVAIFRRRAAR